MSYILDALKKSDQERSRERGPTLASVHGNWRPPQRRGWHMAVGLTVCLVLAAAGWGGLRWWWSEDPSHGGTLPAALSPVGPETDDSAIGTTGADLAPAAGIAVAPTDADPADIALDSGPAATAGSVERQRLQPPLQELWELPDPVRAQLPALTFSFHVYADDPPRRTIIINGRRHSEGDEMPGGLRLEEITRDGVIMQFRDRRIMIPVVNDW